jgi:molecular chaperone DnaJ
MTEDFYDILGVSRDATEEEIEQAYREAVREYHPDVSDDPEAEDKFKKAKTAKEVLTDEEKRQLYDQLGHEQFVQAEKRGATDSGGRGGQGPFGGGSGPFGGGGMQDIFEQFFGGGSGGRGGRSSGSDLRTDLVIDLEDAYHGIEQELTIRRPEECEACDGRGHPPDTDSRTCPECNGQGQTRTVQQTPFGRMQQTRTCRQCEGDGTIYDESCSTCGGNGVVRNQTTLSVEIPAGIRDGQSLRMEGEGAPPEGRGRNGDLLIEVSVREHPDFERDGDDLHRNEAISFPQAVFGDTIEIETLEGTVEMDVPEGTQSGETFRLRNKGMPRLQRRGSGDLFVEVQVVTPEELTDEQREALMAFAEAGGEEVDVDAGFFERITKGL